MKKQNLVHRALIGAALAAVAATAHAHTGHGTGTVLEGVMHPLGLDHLLAMVAVGLWSVFCLPAARAWAGPAVFMAALMAGAVAGVMGLALPMGEALVAASVVLCGWMLVLATRRTPGRSGLGWVVLAGVLHGLAHGAEAPAGGFAGYAAGFLLTTGVLHLGGVMLGWTVVKRFAQRAQLWAGGIGCGFAGAGVYLLSQV